VVFGLLAFRGDLFGEQIRQVIELLAGAVDHGLHINQQQFGQFVALDRPGEGLRNAGAIGGEGLFELVVQLLAAVVTSLS
jgi:hypothetical protein